MYYYFVKIRIKNSGEVGVIQRRRAAVSVSTLRNDVKVPFEKNKMASTLAASVIATWSVHKLQGG